MVHREKREIKVHQGKMVVQPQRETLGLQELRVRLEQLEPLEQLERLGQQGPRAQLGLRVLRGRRDLQE